MDLSVQEQEVITILRRLVGYERIELMKDDKGNLGVDYVIFRASKQRITPTGRVVPQQVRSKATASE